MKVTKAVIPAAGLGTRVLPASKSIPKEMIPIVDKPAIQYLVEEAVAAGITEILIITNRGKAVMEDHFDRSPELEAKLLASGKTKLYDEMVGIANLANITYVRQKETKGLGHAVACARNFVGDEPFAVLYGDDVILGEVSATKELCDEYERQGKGILGVKYIASDKIGIYSSVNKLSAEGTDFLVTDMVEKPKPEQILSNYAIIGRVVLPPSIFDILDRTQPGAGGEIQLTDAMKELAKTEGMVGVEYSGTRYDMGNKAGIVAASLAVALSHPETKDEIRDLVKNIAKIL